MLFYDVTSSLFRGLQDDDMTQAMTSNFVLRPLQPVTRTNGAFNPHHCDEDDMEGRFKKIIELYKRMNIIHICTNVSVINWMENPGKPDFVHQMQRLLLFWIDVFH